MTNNVLAFTRDNWQSASMAIGHVYIGNNDYYGVVAEAIVGNLIAGNELVVTDNVDPDKATFRVDANGVKLHDADFTITSNSGKTLITLSPEDGFMIQKNTDTTGLAPKWENALVEDTNGDIIANSIKLESGEIGGWTIENNRLSNKAGDYIDADGTGKLSLLRYNNGNAYFDGNIYANNLQWSWGDGRDPSFIFSSLGTDSPFLFFSSILFKT